MEPKRAIAFAAAATVVSAAAALAIGANVGLFGLASNHVTPALPIAAEAPIAAPALENEVRYVDVPLTVHVPRGATVTLPPEAVSTTTAPASQAAAVTTSVPETRHSDDDDDDDDDHTSDSTTRTTEQHDRDD